MMFSYVIMAVAVFAYAEGFSHGAPESACKDMVPRHPVSAQTSPPPYKITTSASSVKAGAPIQVTITGNSAKDIMRGLLLQARQGDNIVGTFTVPAGDVFAQTLNCGQPANAVTHKKHDPKDDKQTVTYTWTAPKDLSGEIKFRATIAYNGAVFWVGVESAPVKILA